VSAGGETCPDGAMHALVVGGSGMLAGLCRSLAEDGWQVTVVGRDRAKLARASSGDPCIHPLSANYEEIVSFAAALGEAAAARGPIALAVCWIRSWAPQSLLAAAAAVASGGFFHVLGSQASYASAAAISEMKRRQDLRYRQIQLGAVDDGERRRWLTNEEISAGVYAAVDADCPYYLVGTVAP
jgi:NAD(P)-dependent dehydrogenase (short-subunit alcohol dehydrogenase family)